MLDKYLRDNYSDLYEAMPCSASSQRQSQIVLKNFKSFSKAMKKYRTKKEEFPGRPQLPGYKRKYRTFVVGRNGYSIENGFLSISGAEEFGLPPVPFLCCQNQPFGVKAKDVVCGDFRIVPKGNSFAMEVTYRLFIKRYDVLLNRDNALLVDLGVDNIATCVPTAPGVAPIVFKGGVLKSINWSYNKRMAKLQSSEDKTDENKIKKHNNRKHCKAVAFKRTRRINDLLHKLSHYIIQYCLAYDLGTVIIGKNKNWKQKVNLGKKNNQIFVQLPHDRLIEMIEYKAEAYGINVILADESYTSKASALDFDPVPDYGKENGVKPVFSGKRIKRGLYRTKDGTLINADINGALNIGRKVLGDQWLKTLLANRGQVDRPIVVRNLHASANIKLLLELELRF